MKTLTLAAVVLLLGACASLGLQKPQSFDEQLANAYGVHTAILTSLATAVSQGIIPASEGRDFNVKVENARVVLDAAREAERTKDLTSAAARLSAALQALTTIQTALSARLPTKGGS